MASPEVQRPMASPTNPGVGTVSSRKVVTFDRRYMSPSSRGRSGPTSSSALDVASARGVAQPQRPSVPSRSQTLARSDQKNSGRLRSTRPPGGGRRGRSCGRHSFRNHPEDKDPSNKASPDPEVSDRRVGGADEGGASGAAAPVGGPGPEAAAKRFRPTYSMNLRKRRHPAGVDGGGQIRALVEFLVVYKFRTDQDFYLSCRSPPSGSVPDGPVLWEALEGTPICRFRRR